jgi:hypothetical protein
MRTIFACVVFAACLAGPALADGITIAKPKHDALATLIASHKRVAQNTCTCRTYAGTTCSGPCGIASPYPLGCICEH